MRTELRKIGNAIGLIVPRPLLDEIGVTVGAIMDLKVEDGRLIAAPIFASPRAGWAEDAAMVRDTEEEAEWRGFGNAGDADLEW